MVIELQKNIKTDLCSLLSSVQELVIVQILKK
jgi:hypothetical protein